MSLDTESSRNRGNVQQVLLFVSGGVVLLVTWLVLYVWICVITAFWLVPGYPTPAPQQPPVGTWQRTLNDYLVRLPDALPANVVLATSVFLFLVRLVRGRNRAFLPLEFAAPNLPFIVVHWILVLATYWLPDHQRTWPAVVVTICLLLVLFTAQVGGWLKKWLRIGAMRGAIVGTTVGAMLFGALAGVITLMKGGLAEGGDVLLEIFFGIFLGMFVGVIAGAIAGACSSVFLGGIIGAVIGAIIGGLFSGASTGTLVGGIVGMIVGMIAGAKWEIE